MTSSGVGRRQRPLLEPAKPPNLSFSLCECPGNKVEKAGLNCLSEDLLSYLLILLIIYLAIIRIFDYLLHSELENEVSNLMANKFDFASDWQDLLQIAQGTPLVVERVRIPEKQIAIEGSFTLPELARLSLEDQVFVVAFLRSHGSIKEMEQIFGVSYPTIKARLNRISGLLEFVDMNPSPSRGEVLDRLKGGEISAAEAIRELEAMK